MIEPMVRHRVQIRFKKTDNLRFIGHRDLMRSIERLLRRSQLPVSMSEGFHPKVRMSFPSALALGVSGHAEVMELDLEGNITPDQVLASLNRNSFAGLTFCSVVEMATGRKNKGRVISDTYEMFIPGHLCKITAELIADFLSQESVIVAKSKGKIVDVRAAVMKLVIQADRLKMTLAVTAGSDAGFREVLDQIGLRAELFRTIFPVRTAVNLAEENLVEKH